jgi:hypothetical protein
MHLRDENLINGFTMHGAATEAIVDLVTHPELRGAELEIRRLRYDFIPHSWKSDMTPLIPSCSPNSRLFSTLVRRCGHLHQLTFYDFPLLVEDLQLGAACDSRESIRSFVFKFGTVVVADNESGIVDPRYGVPAMKEVFKKLIRRKATLRLAFMVFDQSRWLKNLKNNFFCFESSGSDDLLLPEVFLELHNLAVTQKVPYVSHGYHGAGITGYYSNHLLYPGRQACMQWDMQRRGDMV